MRKSTISFLFICIFILTLAGCANGSKSSYGTPSTDSSPSPTTKNLILIQSFAFNPSVLTIKAGETVVWQNKDSAVHTVASDSFTSPSIAKDETFKQTFNAKGTYNYICGVHASVKGQIIVE